MGYRRKVTSYLVWFQTSPFHLFNLCLEVEVLLEPWSLRLIGNIFEQGRPPPRQISDFHHCKIDGRWAFTVCLSTRLAHLFLARRRHSHHLLTSPSDPSVTPMEKGVVQHYFGSPRFDVSLLKIRVRSELSDVKMREKQIGTNRDPFQ